MQNMVDPRFLQDSCICSVPTCRCERSSCQLLQGYQILLLAFLSSGASFCVFFSCFKKLFLEPHIVRNRLHSCELTCAHQFRLLSLQPCSVVGTCRLPASLLHCFCSQSAVHRQVGHLHILPPPPRSWGVLAIAQELCSDPRASAHIAVPLYPSHTGVQPHPPRCL